MAAHRSTLCAVGRAALVLMWIAWAFCAPGIARQHVPAATRQPRAAIAALSERLGGQLVKAHKKKPLILDLSLPDDLPSPLGTWLADRISESLAEAHPELEVIPRERWLRARGPAQFAHDRNQEYEQNEERAQSLGAEVLVQGNFAAVPGGIGLTLIASDRISGGESRFEALAEIQVTQEMQSLLTTPLPQRVRQQGILRASMAGIGSPICEICPAPEYTYVAKAKKLQGVVIAQLAVARDGTVQKVSVVHAPNPALATAAIRTVHTWRFKPAENFRGESVPVLVDVAVTFRLGLVQKPAVPSEANTLTKGGNSIATSTVADKSP